jgi:AmiR/NasT family two-component response regulator
VNAPPPAKRPRVMLVNLGPMARIGMRRLLSEDGFEVIGDELVAANVTPEVERLQPDIVVLDLDRTDSQHLSERVRLACPTTKVVLWARTENVMEVIDPGATLPRWVVSGVPEDLLAELSTLQVIRAED